MKLTPEELTELKNRYIEVGVAKKLREEEHVVASLLKKYFDYFKELCKKYHLNPHATTFLMESGEIVDSRKKEIPHAL